VTDAAITSALAAVLQTMPDPLAGDQVKHYEEELAAYFGVAHAVAVASGTAALHTTLLGSGIGPGDEVLVPALSVVMSASPVTYTGATPVFFDCTPDGTDVDYDDLAAKISPRAKAIMPVYLWGRVGDPARLVSLMREHGLRMIEDACQAQGTRIGGKLAGTFGDAGCFSTKDGKLLWSGEGGFILTSDTALAEWCRAFRTHCQTPPTGQVPLSFTGHNYRLAEPLAAIARANLARFPQLLERRQQQTRLLLVLLTDIDGIEVLPIPADWNGYAPLARLHVARPREFSVHLAELGVPNSIGTFHLRACDQRPMFASQGPPCTNAAAFIESLLAPVITDHDDDERIQRHADIITTEAAKWPAC
jgi:dTDP-4-amino-4,6-dideoxygalactose transaminase